MAGNDEGINAWMTVNFLLGSLGGTGKWLLGRLIIDTRIYDHIITGSPLSLSGLDHTVPTIDLGGGSMQLTFYPKEKITIDSAPSDYIVSKVREGSDV